MRKVILSMNVTLDGFMAGPNSEMDWHFKYWNNEMSKYACEQLTRADAILLGRITYDAMAGYWPFIGCDNSYPREDIAFAGMMNNHAKIVFSKSLRTTPWFNTLLIREKVSETIRELKSKPGKDMILYGSGSIASLLIRLGLVDEYLLWVHPLILGKGKPLFRSLKDQRLLQLVDIKKFESGVVLMYYKNEG
jgi:dihydrofolate reductase